LGRDIQINSGGLIPQGASHTGKDFASAPLLLLSLPRNVWSIPTFSAFLALLDNYEPLCGKPEIVTDVERSERGIVSRSSRPDTPNAVRAGAWLHAKGTGSSGNRWASSEIVDTLVQIVAL